jgi:hypothetical protein
MNEWMTGVVGNEGPHSTPHVVYDLYKDVAI